MHWSCEVAVTLYHVCMLRLLDVESSEGRFDSELIFYMVFEYMEQDLDHFISQCQAPGMDEGIVKVCV